MSLKRSRTFGKYGRDDAPIAFKRTRSMPAARSYTGAGLGARKISLAKAATKRVVGLSAAQRAGIKALIENSKEKKLLISRPSAVPVVVAWTDTVTPPTFNALLPSLAPGTGNFQRVGEQVTLAKCILKIGLSLPQTEQHFGPFLVTLFIGRPLITNGVSPQLGQWQQLLMGPNGVATTWESANPTTRILPIDNTSWKVVYRKQYKMGTASAINNTNNDFNFNIDDEIDCTRFCPKTLNYTTANNFPQENLYYFFCVTSTDGIPFGLLTSPLQISSTINQYTDA